MMTLFFYLSSMEGAMLTNVPKFSFLGLGLSQSGSSFTEQSSYDLVPLPGLVEDKRRLLVDDGWIDPCDIYFGVSSKMMYPNS